MIEIKTLKTWVEGLGLRAKGESTAEMLQVALPALNAPLFTIKAEQPDLWWMTHQRRIAASSVNSEWEIGVEPSLRPIARLTKAVQHLAMNFPLLSVKVTESGSDVVIEFKAPIYGEALTGQAFALTASSVIKSVEAFDALSAERARQLAILKEWTVKEKALREKYELPSTATTTSSSASPSPKSFALSRRCPRCNKIIRAGNTACAACGASVA